jgi:hypothetical protein
LAAERLQGFAAVKISLLRDLSLVMFPFVQVGADGVTMREPSRDNTEGDARELSYR